MANTRLAPFAEQLRRYRRDHGLTQEVLAERAGLSARGIRALEQGERTSPHRETVRLLAEALGLEQQERADFEESARLVPSVANRELPRPVGGFVGATPPGPLVGREAEMAALLESVDALLAGTGQVVVLAGEPGVGKTRLAQELTLHFRARGAVVAAGQCYAPEQAIPYYPFVDALTQAVRAAPPSLRGEIPRRWPHLDRLLPDRRIKDGGGEVLGYDVQQALFWAASGFLAELADIAPVALLLDDLHWADDSTLRLFQHLARHLHADRVFLLGTYRDVDVAQAHLLERILADLRRDGLLRQLMVPRLDKAGTTALVASTLKESGVTDRLAELLHRRTEGNPFFTLEVVRALVERGDLLDRVGDGGRGRIEEIVIPASVRSAIGERVSRLGDASRSLLHEASVLGQAFTFRDLAAMTDLSEDQLDAALMACARAGLVRPAAEDEFRFSHALVQQVLYEELSPGLRRRLHRSVGTALEGLPVAVRERRTPELAWHFAQADERGRALQYSMQAGDQAEAVFAHAEAERSYRTALELARASGDPRGEADVLRRLGAVLRVLARYEEALRSLERAAELYLAAGDPEGEARTMRELGMAHYYRGSPDRGIARIEAAIDRLERFPASPTSSRTIAELHTALTICLWPLARYSEVLVAAERAVEMAREAGAVRTRSVAETMHGKALTMVGALPEARRVLEEAISSFSVGGDPWEPGQPQGDLGRTYIDEGDLQLARRWLERSRELIEAAHEPAETAWIVSCLGELAFVRGDWPDAEGAYVKAIEMAREADSGRYLSYTLIHRAELYSARGDWDLATLDIEASQELARAWGAVPALRKAQRLLAERDLFEARPRIAIDRLEPLLEQTKGEWPRAFPPPALAEAYLAVGDEATAASLIDRRVGQLRTRNHRRALVPWLGLQAVVVARQGRAADADAALSEALSIARSMPCPYAEASTLQQGGFLYSARGASEHARASLEAALLIFSGLGARPEVRRTQHALSSL